MAHTHLPRLTAFAVAAGLALTTQVSTASADVEAGAFAGGHYFSHNNELGVPDAPDATSLRNSVIFGIRAAYLFSPILGVEGELGLVPTEAREQVFDVWTLTYRAHLIAQLGYDNPKRKWIPFALAGVGAMSVLKSDNQRVISKDTDELFEAGVGVKYLVDNDWALRFDLRGIWPPSSANHFAAFDAEALIGVSKIFGRKHEKKAPPPPPPPPVGDTDGDGIKDDKDQCVQEPEDKDGFQDDDGCPDPDNDKDGVADTVDQCPNDPEDVDGFSDEDGCPDPDNDGDGILDAQDKCPNDAEDKDGFQDDDGCPDPDNDNDGIPDASDQCPDQPETVNGYQDTDGCPDDVPKVIAQFTGVIKGITFKNDSDVILKSSNKTLDAAVKVLKDYPDLHLEIQGHTDDVGKPEHNMDLSQRRADSVKKYFVGKGIDETRLTAVGYGSTIPKVAKKTKAARAQNRRVEFKLVSALTPPTTAPTTQPTPPATQPTPPTPAPATP